MALRAVLDHPKFARLRKLLGLRRCPALGYLEGLWHFTGRYAPHGDLGKFTDLDIESWLEWEGDDGTLIAALITAGWIDRDSKYRLIVHDWKQHADNGTKLAVKRSGEPFVTRTPDSVDTKPVHVDTTESTPSAQCGDTVVENHDTETTTRACTSTRACTGACACTSTGASAREKQLPFSAPPSGEPAPPGDEEHLAPQSGVKKPQRSADERLLVRQVFDFYVQQVGLDPARCHLTQARAEKAYTRLDYCMKLAKGDPQQALNLMCEAVAGLVANDWLMGRDPKTDGKRWTDFNENVFRSDEQMEKRWEDYRRKSRAS